jgi:uncharacterized protein YidB (DUF937 family)
MKRLSKWWIAAAGAAILAVAGAGAVMAQTPVPGTSTTGTSFLSRVAQKLGIDTPTLENAVKSARTDEIDARVASGDLTQAQADALKERIANAPADAPFFGFGGPGGHGRMERNGVGDPQALADFLGITPEQLHTELSADGATLATVAEAQGKSRDELKAFLTEQAKTHLDQEVADGEITQAQADVRLADMTANLDTRIDSTAPVGPGRGHDGMGPMDGPGWGGGFGAPAIPGATDTPSTNNG